MAEAVTIPVIGNGDIDFGGGVLTCSNEFVIAGFAPDGTHRFSRVVGTGAVTDISATNTSVAFTGYTNGTLDFGGGSMTSAGDDDVVLAVLDPNGNQLHASLYGGTEEQGGMAIVHDDDGSPRIVGEVARGETVGEMALLTGQPRVATVCAARDTLLMRLDRSAFDSLFKK